MNAEDEGTVVSKSFFLFLILGFVLVFVGIIILLIATVIFGGGSASFGAVIFIGPFPIVVGAGPEATLLVLLSIILAVISVIILLIMRRKVRWSGS